LLDNLQHQILWSSGKVSMPFLSGTLEKQQARSIAFFVRRCEGVIGFLIWSSEKPSIDCLLRLGWWLE